MTNLMETMGAEHHRKLVAQGLVAPKKVVAACNECGKKFYSVKAAESAAFGDNGCPKCGGADIEAV